ncbi:MarR family winged helix-turn-helix transcriptional regulator [Thermomonospora amylolytica]|uniref:MarR family winged helix-turn-helix transcriptional regulator n=1 Tax=Thermomonospora amylolytica TaxID=1411117 RepID=UPI000E6C6690|nr:MarR family transcriptional regulator [Thermomonospora amylolytica]
MDESSQEKIQAADDQSLERSGRAFIAVWCRAQEQVAGHVPPSQLRALEIVAAHPGISMRELADDLQAMPSSASRLCDRLEAAGLLTRVPVRTDRRQVSLRLTPAGDRLIRDLNRQRRRDLDAVLERMTPQERERLGQGLAAFAERARPPDPC